jgi:D-sedoheptulose 7-phosphate isomerase
MALNQAKSKRLISIGMTGNQGGAFKDLCDHTIEIPSSETPHIQEGHLMVGHIICGLVESIIFKKESDA